MIVDKSIETPEEIAETIIGLYEEYGSDDYIGEPVSQLEHMHQAANLARKAGYPNDVILAAFFHDIGHFCEHVINVQRMDGFGVVDHEKLGADFLRSKGFSEKIARLVQHHVQAKRYLTFKSPAYYDQLSEASRATLSFQGGMMTEKEANAFEADPLFDLYIQLRKWDEQAKMEHQPSADLDYYKRLIVAELQRELNLNRN